MTVTNQNLKIYRGDSAIIKVNLTTALGEAYTPAGDDVWVYKIAPNSWSPDTEILIAKTNTDNGITFLNSVATINISGDETITLPPGLYHHELKITDPPSDKSTVMTGTLVVRPALSFT